MNIRNKTFYILFNPKPFTKQQSPTYIDILSNYLYLIDINNNYQIIQSWHNEGKIMRFLY